MKGKWEKQELETLGRKEIAKYREREKKSKTNKNIISHTQALLTIFVSSLRNK